MIFPEGSKIRYLFGTYVRCPDDMQGLMMRLEGGFCTCVYRDGTKLQGKFVKGCHVGPNLSDEEKRKKKEAYLSPEYRRGDEKTAEPDA